MPPALQPGLLGIATIDQQGRPGCSHQRQSDAASEPGQPVQALIRGSQVFIEIAIASGHQKGIDAPTGQLLAQRFETLHHKPRGWRYARRMRISSSGSRYSCAPARPQIASTTAIPAHTWPKAAKPRPSG
ncbi:hypothetical protein D3C76_1536880 [compost metagenome]